MIVIDPAAPEITINGVELTDEQAHTVAYALIVLKQELAERPLPDPALDQHMELAVQVCDLCYEHLRPKEG